MHALRKRMRRMRCDRETGLQCLPASPRGNAAEEFYGFFFRGRKLVQAIVQPGWKRDRKC